MHSLTGSRNLTLDDKDKTCQAGNSKGWLHKLDTLAFPVDIGLVEDHGKGIDDVAQFLDTGSPYKKTVVETSRLEQECWKNYRF